MRRRAVALAVAVLFLQRTVVANPSSELYVYTTHTPEEDGSSGLQNRNVKDLQGIVEHVHQLVIPESEDSVSPEARLTRKWGVQSLVRYRMIVKNPDSVPDMGPYQAFDNMGPTPGATSNGHVVGMQRQTQTFVPFVDPTFWYSFPGRGLCGTHTGIFGTGNDFDHIMVPTGQSGCTYSYDPNATIVSLDSFSGIHNASCNGGSRCRDWADFRLNCDDSELRQAFAPNGTIVDVSYCVEYDIHPECAAPPLGCDNPGCSGQLIKELGLDFWSGRCEADTNSWRVERAAAEFGVPGALTTHAVNPLSEGFTPRSCMHLDFCRGNPQYGENFCTRLWSGVCSSCRIPGTAHASANMAVPVCPWNLGRLEDYREQLDIASRTQFCRTGLRDNICCLYANSCSPGKNVGNAIRDVSSVPTDSHDGPGGLGQVLAAQALNRQSDVMYRYVVRLARERFDMSAVALESRDEKIRAFAYWAWELAPPHRWMREETGLRSHWASFDLDSFLDALLPHLLPPKTTTVAPVLRVRGSVRVLIANTSANASADGTTLDAGMVGVVARSLNLLRSSVNVSCAAAAQDKIDPEEPANLSNFSNLSNLSNATGTTSTPVPVVSFERQLRAGSFSIEPDGTVSSCGGAGCSASAHGRSLQGGRGPECTSNDRCWAVGLRTGNCCPDDRGQTWACCADWVPVIHTTVEPVPTTTSATTTTPAPTTTAPKTTAAPPDGEQPSTGGDEMDRSWHVSHSAVRCEYNTSELLVYPRTLDELQSPHDLEASMRLWLPVAGFAHTIRVASAQAHTFVLKETNDTSADEGPTDRPIEYDPTMHTDSPHAAQPIILDPRRWGGRECGGGWSNFLITLALLLVTVFILAWGLHQNWAGSTDKLIEVMKPEWQAKAKLIRQKTFASGPRHPEIYLPASERDPLDGSHNHRGLFDGIAEHNDREELARTRPSIVQVVGAELARELAFFATAAVSPRKSRAAPSSVNDPLGASSSSVDDPPMSPRNLLDRSPRADADRRRSTQIANSRRASRRATRPDGVEIELAPVSPRKSLAAVENSAAEAGGSAANDPASSSTAEPGEASGEAPEAKKEQKGRFFGFF